MTRLERLWKEKVSGRTEGGVSGKWEEYRRERKKKRKDFGAHIVLLEPHPETGSSRTLHIYFLSSLTEKN
jgi:hypothetical protein